MKIAIYDNRTTMWITMYTQFENSLALWKNFNIFQRNFTHFIFTAKCNFLALSEFWIQFFFRFTLIYESILFLCTRLLSCLPFMLRVYLRLCLRFYLRLDVLLAPSGLFYDIFERSAYWNHRLLLSREWRSWIWNFVTFLTTMLRLPICKI